MKGLKKRTLIKETAAIDHSKGGREGMEEGKGYWREEKAGKGEGKWEQGGGAVEDVCL